MQLRSFYTSLEIFDNMTAYDMVVILKEVQDLETIPALRMC